MADDLYELVQTKLKNVDAEVTVLAYMYKVKVFEFVELDHFSSRIYRFFFKVLQKHRSVTKSMLFSEIKKGIKPEKHESYNAACVELFETKVSTLKPKSIKLMADELMELYKSRFILLKVDEIADLVLKRQIDDAQVLAREAAVVGTTSKKHGKDYLADYERRTDVVKAKIEDPSNVGVPTGIDKFDNRSGGVIYGEFGIVAGHTSVGKSVALENFAINAWNGQFNCLNKNHNVLYISLEMSADDLLFRADARMTRILHSKFRIGRDWEKKDWKKWKATIQRLRHDVDTFFHIEYVPGGCDVADIENIAERIQDQYGKELDLLVVDYLNIMGSGTGGNREWGFQADYAWGLKGLAADFNGGRGLALWTANQLKGSAEEKTKITTSDLKYSGAIGEVAPLVVGLSRSSADIVNRELQFQVVKFRNSGVSMAPIILKPNYDIAMLHDELLYKHKTLENF